MDSRRRTSMGKSSFVDMAIQIIEDFQNSKGAQLEIIASSLDRTLFNEIRSVAWRVFLNLLPAKSPSEWVSITKQQRKEYDEETEKIDSEETQKVVKTREFEFMALARTIVKEESKKSMIFNSLSESAQKIFVLWLRKNDNVSSEHFRPLFRILLTLMFALYPSMLNVASEECDIKKDNKTPSAKELYYFLNCEDYFDHDIYWIFTEIMNRGIKDLVTCTDKKMDNTAVNELYSKVQLCQNNGKKVAQLLSGVGRADISFLYYLGVCDEELVKKLVEKNRNIIGVIHSLISTLFYDFDYESLIYLWDCVFACENNSQFDFSLVNKHQKRLSLIDFLACSLISKTNPSILLEGDLEKACGASFEANLIDSDYKSIVLTALKLREKITNLYEEN